MPLQMKVPVACGVGCGDAVAGRSGCFAQHPGEQQLGRDGEYEGGNPKTRCPLI
jgi:hypothetical protein